MRRPYNPDDYPGWTIQLGLWGALALFLFLGSAAKNYNERMERYEQLNGSVPSYVEVA